MSEQNGLPDIPKNWVRADLGQVVNIISGYGFPEKYQGQKSGDIPFFKVADISIAVKNGSLLLTNSQHYISFSECEEIKAKPLKKGTIVFAKIGEAIKLNRRAILAQDSLVDNNVMGLYSFSEGLNHPFLFYFFLTVKLGEISQATTVPSVRKSDIENVSIPLPPLAEQHRIVAKIEELFAKLDAGVKALRTARAQLRRYRQSVLKAAVTGELTRGWREAHRGELEPASELLARILRERREKWEADQLAKMKAAGKTPKNDDWKKKYQEPAAPDVTSPFMLPKGWELASLEAITSAVRVICYGILMPKDNVPDGILYVKVKDMKGDRINLESLHRTTEQIAGQYARASLLTGDLLLAIRGTYGRVAEVPPELNGGNITQDTARLEVSPHLSSKYIATYLRSPEAQNYFKRVARGVAVKGVNIGEVRTTPVLIPPSAEQEFIETEVERLLSITDATERTIEQSLKQAERLRQSILKQAFEGQLVPQDHADEPAEVLLARIREERVRKQDTRQKVSRAPRKAKRETQMTMLD